MFTDSSFVSLVWAAGVQCVLAVLDFHTIGPGGDVGEDFGMVRCQL